MTQPDVLNGKKILVVDDEPDILETITEILGMCETETAQDYETAAHLLRGKSYDMAILDIMGVNGYGLLEIANQNDIPALMLTAHALTADNLVASIKGGAYAYLPKNEMVNIEGYMVDLLESRKNNKKSNAWYKKLLPFFNNSFGDNWKEKDPEFWMDFDRTLEHSKEELEKIL